MDRITHVLVPAGQESAVAQALAGPFIDLEPVCPICGRLGASRMEKASDTGEVVHVPCYLTWCAASGVTAAVREGATMPPYRAVPCADGVGTTSAWQIKSVRCDACDYHSAPSAFCRPTGPSYQPGSAHAICSCCMARTHRPGERPTIRVGSLATFGTVHECGACGAGCTLIGCYGRRSVAEP